MAICVVARRLQPHQGDAPSSRLASGQAAFPPKPEVSFAQTLNGYGRLRGWGPVAHYAEQESGAKATRPELDRLLRDIRTHADDAGSIVTGYC